METVPTQLSLRPVRVAGAEDPKRGGKSNLEGGLGNYQHVVPYDHDLNGLRAPQNDILVI